MRQWRVKVGIKGAGVELFFRDSLACALIKSALPFAIHRRALLSRARYLFAAHWLPSRREGATWGGALASTLIECGIASSSPIK